MNPPSLCESCARMRPVVTPKGSRFLLCQLAAVDPAYAKYPPQPVVRCAGHVSAVATLAPDTDPDSQWPPSGHPDR
jgi:hypothetical protein